MTVVAVTLDPPRDGLHVGDDTDPTWLGRRHAQAYVTPFASSPMRDVIRDVAESDVAGSGN